MLLIELNIYNSSRFRTLRNRQEDLAAFDVIHRENNLLEPKAGRNKIVSLDGVFEWIDGVSLQKEFDDGVNAMLANQKAGFKILVKPAHKFPKDVLEHGENILTHEVVPLQGEQGGSILEHEVLLEMKRMTMMLIERRILTMI